MSESVVADGYDADLNLWLGRKGLQDYPAHREFVRLTDALRLVQDRVAAARPSADAAGEAADLLQMVERILAGFEVEEPTQVAARLLDDPGRGQTLLPPFELDFWDDTAVRGRTGFARFHLGSNGAAHGGAISMLFDDLLGQLANAPGQPRARTASIRVEYRRITPINRELAVTAEVVRREGRKITIVGELRDGPRLLARADGLFIQLRPGQP